MPEPFTVAGLAKAAGVRLGWQNFNKALSRFGLDDIPGRIFGSKKAAVPPVTLSIYAFGFLTPFPPNSEVTNLRMALKANETLSLERVTVLFNRTGGNGSYELAAFAPPRVMHQGEEINLTVLHHRDNFSTFWGDEHPVTQPIKDIDSGLWDEHATRLLMFVGPYYCEIVAAHTKGETRKRFTILNTNAPGKPGIVDPSDHQDYDPDRHIPAHGKFWD